MNKITTIKNSIQKYSLLEMGFNNQDLKKGIDVLKTGFITMNKETEKFEKIFAQKLNVKYALMVNSGSSANLLAAFAALAANLRGLAIQFISLSPFMVPMALQPILSWFLCGSALVWGRLDSFAIHILLDMQRVWWEGCVFLDMF